MHIPILSDAARAIVNQVRSVHGALAASLVEADLAPLALGAKYGSHRKHPHLPQFTKGDGRGASKKPRRDMAPLRRRGHGLGRHVDPTPATIRSAIDNARDYMHAAARRRFDARHATRLAA